MSEWERLEGEPHRWFRRFEAYRLLGGRRTIEAVYRAESRAGGSKGKRPNRHWYAHAKQYQWEERAAAWDKYLVDQAAEEIKERWQKEIMGEVELLGRLSSMARADIGQAAQIEGGQLVGFSEEFLEKYGFLVKRLTTTSGEKSSSVGIEMVDGQAALVIMGKYLGLFKDRTEISQPGGQPITGSNVHIYIPDNGRDPGVRQCKRE